MRIPEKTKGEFEEKLKTISSDFSRIKYVEEALKENMTMDVQRFLNSTLSQLYENSKMYEKAAKALSMRAAIEITYREKIETLSKAGELYAKAGKISEAEHEFTKALRESNSEQAGRVKLTMKNVFMMVAKDLERQGKRTSCVPYYQKLLQSGLLEDIEKQEIKAKLLEILKATGKFRDAKLVEGL